MNQSTLIVGAGCVGQVFAHHLARGGASVTLFVRDKYREEAQRGFTLYRLRTLHKAPESARFVPTAVISDTEALRGLRFDQVYLTVASPALSGHWLNELVQALGDATLVSLQPGRNDLQRVQTAGASPHALVAGGIGFVAYTAPLAGETRFTEPGTAYWLPPLGRSQFSGDAMRVRAVVTALQSGGLPATTSDDVHRQMAFPNAIGMTYLLALESAGWSERALRTSKLMPLYREAVRQAMAVVSADERHTPFITWIANSPALLHLGFSFGRYLAPLPLEACLEKHFTKVGVQTRQIIGALIARGHAASLPVAKLEELLALVPPQASPQH